MNNKELGKALKQLNSLRSAGSPDKEFISRNREILMMQIKNTTSQRKKSFGAANAWSFFEAIFPDSVFKFVVRPALVGIMVFGLAFGGWAATVSASYNSLPGDTLYSLKIATEKAQLSIASKEDKVSLNIEFVGRRVDDLAKIAEKTSIEDKEERTVKAVEALNKQLIAVKDTLEDLEEGDAEKAVEAAKLVDRKTAEFNIALEKTKETLPEEVQEHVGDAADLANDTGIKAVKMIIENADEEELAKTSEELFIKIEEKLKIVEDSIVKIDEEVIQLEEGIIGATEVVVEGADVVEGKAVEGASIEEKSIKIEIKVAEETTEEAKGVLDEVKEAIENKDLGTAIDKLVEAKNIVNGAIVDENPDEVVVGDGIIEEGVIVVEEGPAEEPIENVSSSTLETVEEEII